MFSMRFIILGIALMLVWSCNICCVNNKDVKSETPPDDETIEIIDEVNPDFVIWELSLSVARNLNDFDERAVALEVIAESLALSARFDKAVNVALEIESDFLQARVLATISNLMHLFFETDMSIKTMEKALEACDRMDDSLDKSSVLMVIASCFKSVQNQ